MAMPSTDAGELDIRLARDGKDLQDTPWSP